MTLQVAARMMHKGVEQVRHDHTHFTLVLTQARQARWLGSWEIRSSAANDAGVKSRSRDAGNGHGSLGSPARRPGSPKRAGSLQLGDDYVKGLDWTLAFHRASAERNRSAEHRDDADAGVEQSKRVLIKGQGTPAGAAHWFQITDLTESH